MAGRVRSESRVVKTWAIFLYGVSGGLAIASGLTTVLLDDSIDAGWFAVAAAVALAGGLITHQRSSRIEKGRRWRKTCS
jgi:hypothetical protein